MKSIASFLDAEGYLPHGYCLLWQPEIVWLHVLSDAGIASAYYGIPAVLFYFIQKRGDLPHERIFWLLGAFILLCGTTHLAAILVLWQPYFGIEGLIKAATAIVSVATFALSIKLLPQALQIPSAAQLRRLNDELRHSIAEREKAEHELMLAYGEMENTVASRTAELRDTLARLSKSNADLEQFAFIASHDLKEPLRGLSFHAAALLEDYGDKLDEAGLRRLKRLMQIPAKMDALISDLHKFARLGHEDLTLSEADLNDVVNDIEDMLELQLKESHARIVVRERLPQVVCDRAWMGRVFYNLITNAIKYNDKPAPVVEIGHMRKALEGHEEQDVFYVRDNGMGIDPKFHQLIFDIFKRLNPEDAERRGTGMGLSFVRRIVERHNGHVWVESTPGEGTTFFFTIARPAMAAVA